MRRLLFTALIAGGVGMWAGYRLRGVPCPPGVQVVHDTLRIPVSGVLHSETTRPPTTPRHKPEKRPRYSLSEADSSPRWYVFTSETLKLRVRAIFADTFVAEVPRIHTTRMQIREKPGEVFLKVWSHRAVEVGVGWKTFQVSGMLFPDQGTWSVGVGIRWRF